MLTMAAIIEPRRVPVRSAERPVLRLVSAHDGRAVSAPVDLGFSSLYIVGAVVAMLAAMLLALAIGNGALAGLAPGPSGTPAVAAASSTGGAGATQVTVEAGDTLWSIARRVQPSGDIRPLVDRLVAAYGTTPLQPGQQLAIPA
jgi:hypothetical protein